MHLTLLHLFTDYRITEKSISDMTILQYRSILKITDEIEKYKTKNKPMVVI